MKIVLLTRSLRGGGAEKVTSILANEFSLLGHDVQVICFADSQDEYPILPEVRIHRITNRLRLAAAFQLRNVIKKTRPDLTISLGSKYDLVLLSGIMRKNFVILSERNEPSSFYKSRLILEITRYCYKKSAGVVFQTNEARNYFKELPAATTTIIKNPVASDLPRWNGPPGSQTVITFGRLEPQKNLGILINAFQKFQQDFSEYKLHIYGNGSQHEYLTEKVKSLDLEKSVSIFDATVDIHHIVAGSTIYVNSSEYEGISNSLLESLCMGVPSIATDSLGGGSRELIDDGVNGFLVPRNDVERLAIAMKELASDEHLQTRFSRRASSLQTKLTPSAISLEWLRFADEIRPKK